MMDIAVVVFVIFCILVVLAMIGLPLAGMIHEIVDPKTLDKILFRNDVQKFEKRRNYHL